MSRRRVARDLSMSVPTLTNWIAKYGEDPSRAHSGQFASEEIRKLRKENEQLRMERDIL